MPWKLLLRISVYFELIRLSNLRKGYTNQRTGHPQVQDPARPGPPPEEPYWGFPLTQSSNAIKYDYMKIQSKPRTAAVIVKIGVSRQVAIPKKLHDQLGLAPGDYLQVELEGDRLILTPKALVEKRLAEGLDRLWGTAHAQEQLARALLNFAAVGAQLDGLLHGFETSWK